MKNVRNPAMARLKGTSGNSKGEHFFDLLSGRSGVRIPLGALRDTRPAPDRDPGLALCAEPMAF